MESDAGPSCLKAVDNTIHWINCYLVDKCQQNKPCYPLDSDLSGAWGYPPEPGF